MFQEYYQDKINRLENEANYWISLANAEYAKNNAHTKQEVLYRQHAATIISKMANESVGSAKDFFRRRLDEINNQIRTAIMEFDPDFFKRNGASNDGAEANKPDSKKSASAASSSSKSGSSKKGGVDDETRKSWHKDIPDISFEDDVQGMKEEKDKLISCAQNSRFVSLMDYLDIDRNQAFLLYGPPGTGKTYLVKAFVHELAKLDSNFDFISLNGSDILSKYVGDAETTVAAVFDEAVKCAPCIVFIDELDGVCKNRSMEHLPEYASSLTTAFLTGYNTLDYAKEQVIFIGATNYPANIDKAMLDRVEPIYISYPDAEPRIGVFKRSFNGKISLADGFTWEEIGQMTEPKTEEIQSDDGSVKTIRKDVFNQRDLKKLCNEIKILILKEAVKKYENETAAVAALKDGSFGLNREIFEKALELSPPQDHSKADKEIEFFENGGWDNDR